MATTTKDRRSLVVLGAAAAVALGILLLVMTRGHGGAGANLATALNPPVALGGGTEASPEPTPSAEPTLVFSGRDPFKSVLKPSPSPEPSPAAEPSPSPQPSASPTTQVPSASGASSVILDGHKIELVDVFMAGDTPTVQVEVDAKSYTVKPGETFAKNYKLVSVEGQAVNFLYGDLPFTLETPASS